MRAATARPPFLRRENGPASKLTGPHPPSYQRSPIRGGRAADRSRRQCRSGQRRRWRGVLRRAPLPVPRARRVQLCASHLLVERGASSRTPAGDSPFTGGRAACRSRRRSGSARRRRAVLWRAEHRCQCHEHAEYSFAHFLLLIAGIRYRLERSLIQMREIEAWLHWSRGSCGSAPASGRSQGRTAGPYRSRRSHGGCRRSEHSHPKRQEEKYLLNVQVAAQRMGVVHSQRARARVHSGGCTVAVGCTVGPLVRKPRAAPGSCRVPARASSPSAAVVAGG